MVTGNDAGPAKKLGPGQTHTYLSEDMFEKALRLSGDQIYSRRAFLRSK